MRLVHLLAIGIDEFGEQLMQFFALALILLLTLGRTLLILWLILLFSQLQAQWLALRLQLEIDVYAELINEVAKEVSGIASCASLLKFYGSFKDESAEG